MRKLILIVCMLLSVPVYGTHAQKPDAPAHEPDQLRLPADQTTHQTVELPGRILRFAATAGSLPLRDGKNALIANVAFTAYQLEGGDATNRPVAFVFNGGPGMASAWLQMGALGPWRVRLDPHMDDPSSSPVPVPNGDTWLDFTDLVFIDPPGTGYSPIVSTDADVRRRLWSVGGDIDALAITVRRWLDHNGRMQSPKFIVGESYGGFRGPRLVRALQSDDGVGISGLVLLSPLLDAHDESGFADPMSWVDLLPSEVAVVRALRGPVTRADMADVEAYSRTDYITDILRGEHDPAALDRLTSRISAFTGLDPAVVRRMHGRIDSSLFLQRLAPAQVASVFDGTAMRPDPSPRELRAQFPDPVLGGFNAPVTEAMMVIYDRLNWHPDMVYHLSSDAAFDSWDWGHGMGRPESLSALQSARSVDPHLRVLVAQGLYDLRTPYGEAARLLDMLPTLQGAAPVVLKVYAGGHMFYFDDASRAALRQDAKAVFDPAGEEEGSR